MFDSDTYMGLDTSVTFHSRTTGGVLIRSQTNVPIRTLGSSSYFFKQTLTSSYCTQSADISGV